MTRASFLPRLLHTMCRNHNSLYQPHPRLHPPRFLCPGCGSDALVFKPSAGQGRIFSWTLTHRPVDPGWAAEGLPYATVVVEMEEGIRLVGGWRGSPDVLCLDLRVQAEVEPATEAFAFLYFRPHVPLDVEI